MTKTRDYVIFNVLFWMTKTLYEEIDRCRLQYVMMASRGLP